MPLWPLRAFLSAPPEVLSPAAWSPAVFSPGPSWVESSSPVALSTGASRSVSSPSETLPTTVLSPPAGPPSGLGKAAPSILPPPHRPRERDLIGAQPPLGGSPYGRVRRRQRRAVGV